MTFQPIHRFDRLADLYTPFAEKMEEYRRVASKDMRAAERIFAEAQQMAQAWQAGAAYAMEARRE
ncbi:MAG TPA: hypothetical protein VG897_08260 [Terriglobales bacterium]|nr:hypothetical protein [Terriglobales bacterium]